MPPSPHYTSYHHQQLQQQQQQQHPTYHSSHHQQHQAYVVAAGGTSELKGSQGAASFSFPQVSACPSQPCMLKGLSNQMDFRFCF
jgi:hypothetical protein